MMMEQIDHRSVLHALNYSTTETCWQRQGGTTWQIEAIGPNSDTITAVAPTQEAAWEIVLQRTQHVSNR